jgi:DnaJ family protein C protein 19
MALVTRFFRGRVSLPVTLGNTLFTSAINTKKDEQQVYEQRILQLQTIQARAFHLSARRENLTPIIVGGGIAAVAFAGSKLIEAYDAHAAAKAAAAEAAASGEAGKQGSTASSQSSSGFMSWFNFGKRYYEGGFEPEMTKREAALILGIRESAPREKVREAHRRLAMLNHPDMGGSTFIASKINEAKDKLMGAN